MPVYRYYCCSRSPHDSNFERTVPEGSVGSRIWGSRPYVPEAGCTVYGTVDYPHRISSAEMTRYGLMPANMIQQPIMVAI